ncbi:MAG TPA: glycoside hydrolase domain-containing protein, partial [Flavisolibacter sp.]|nr:glycoside hydrolase domain-containing protein [Flavisolibacter sp.]
MKKFIVFGVLLVALQAIGQEVPYRSCDQCWNPDSLGSHRAVVKVSGNSKAVRVLIPWRRRDQSPDEKRIIVQDQKTGARIMHTALGTIDREKGEIYFEPVSGAGTYYVYYMP